MGRTTKTIEALVGEGITTLDGEAVVQPSCREDHGHWYCETHGRTFPNNLVLGGHLGDTVVAGDEGMHRLAWLCHEHGPEQP